MNQEEEDRQYKKMTQTPVWKLVLILGLPTTVSMLITNIYNTADTFFVSRISVAASGATGIVFALMAILQAFGFMFGHGAGSNISRLLGARKVEHAKIYASTSVFLSLAVGAVIGIGGLIFLEPLIRLLGSTDTILNDAKIYGSFILLAGPAMTVSCVLNNILRYEGRAAFAMIGLTTGGILNMILDPILIFYFHMDIAGAGLATALSQYVSAVILLFPFLRGKTVTKIHIIYVTRDFSDVRNIILTGLPSLTRQGLNSICTTLLNVQAGVYGDAAIAAMSIVGRCGNLLFSFALGIAQGFQPVCAFNYGAGKYRRVKKATYFTVAMGMGILCILCGICCGNAENIIYLFREEPEILEIGTGALRWLCGFLIVLPVSAVGSMLFQSTGMKGRALFIAAMQSGVILIPLLIFLPRFFGLTGLQMAQPLAYFLAGLITVPVVLNFFSSLPEDS